MGDTGLWYVFVCDCLSSYCDHEYFSAISYLFVSAPFILSLLSSSQIFPPHWLSHCSGIALDLCSGLERRTLTWGEKNQLWPLVTVYDHYCWVRSSKIMKEYNLHAYQYNIKKKKANAKRWSWQAKKKKKKKRYLMIQWKLIQKVNQYWR